MKECEQLSIIAVMLYIIHNINLTIKKHQKSPNLKDSLQNNWFVIFTTVKVLKAKEKRRNYSKLRDIEEIRQLTAMCHSELGFLLLLMLFLFLLFCYESHY